MMFKQLGRFAVLAVCLFALVCASVCPPVAADIFTSGKIVYTTNALGDLDIAVMGPNGEHRKMLTSDITDEFDPTSSPDGTEVLYVVDAGWVADDYRIMLMDADGSNHRQIFFGELPSWSPDGDRFGARETGIKTLSIFTLNDARDGYSNRDSIVFSGNPTSPAWSPDGKYIAYVAGGHDHPWVGGSLYVYDVAAESSTKIVSGSPGRNMSNPTWGPQSYRIVFAWENAGFQDGNRIIFSVRRDGGGLRWEHASDGNYLYHPTVAPYGGEFIFARHYTSNNNRYLYKVTRGSNNWQRIGRTDATFNDDADWWHPSYFSVEPDTSKLTTTWGSLKKKAK